MSKYNKTILTDAGLELAKKANAGKAKFQITRAVTSSEDLSGKTITELQALTELPSIMQNGTILDAEPTQTDNAILSVSLRFTNKDLTNSYPIRNVGLYVKEEGKDHDFLYALATAQEAEFMPDYSDQVLYRFNLQMYVVVGRVQSVTVEILDGTSVPYDVFNRHVEESNTRLEDLENTRAKSATVNGSEKVLPDDEGNLALTVPNPDLSNYPTRSEVESLTDLTKIKFRKQFVNGTSEAEDKTWSAKKNADGTYTIDIFNDDWTAIKLVDLIKTVGGKADKATVDALTTRVNTLSGTTESQNKVGIDANTLTTTGVYRIETPTAELNYPTSNGGVLNVLNGVNSRLVQIYYPDNNEAPYYRFKTDNNWKPWVQLASASGVYAKTETYNKTDVNNLLENVGKVKSATVNGGAQILPTEDGTLPLIVPDPDLSGLATKKELSKAVKVKTVDGNEPDSNGNVSTNSVKKVNGVSPDSNGNATINVGVKKVNNTFPDSNGNVATIQIFDNDSDARQYSANHPDTLTGILL
ncbi:hypothetical protein GCM10022297_01010 [Lactobacillus hamsteri]|uniref:Uncharacterized protein n=1 Tax=Lactobacillus hamsteri DSM 5661 = JCM 6256 TaxID=1423754 RepID=A0A0R1Y4D5_9LACO|nr:pyocin knob domain-containing protein [Lactobacillus hamsteri]KRM36991.1 hypothetical protein FC39_GL000443 [Lactobacillus hamsteri DSM 5661 = JCM 6256]